MSCWPSSAPARQQHRQRSDIGARAAERAGWAGAGSQAREGSPRGRRPPSYAPMSSPSPHLALDDGTCDTSVPTVRARQGKGMQLLDTCPDRPLARATFRLRRSEKKILSHERYTQLRNGAARALVAFPVVSHLLPLHQLSFVFVVQRSSLQSAEACRVRDASGSALWARCERRWCAV